ncbi:MAG: hypothetical protein IT324_21500 [Anaerolineae bacterium]|nr:hypothetical protein [Anaerolineae bacterium]
MRGIPFIYRISLAVFLSVLTACSAIAPQSGIRTALQLDDNFTDNQNNWDLADHENSGAKIEAGALTLNVKKLDWTAWYAPGVLFPEDIDVEAAVAVPTSTTAPDWSYGIHVRASSNTSPATYYACSVTETGQWRINVRLQDSVKLLKSGTFTTSFNPQNANVIRCRIKGDTISMYMNQKLLGSIQDTALPRNNNPKYFHFSAYNGRNQAGTIMQAVFRSLKVRPAN